ncbi:hypothetical protein ACGO3R_07055 [Lactococcus lactis]
MFALHLRTKKRLEFWQVEKILTDQAGPIRRLLTGAFLGMINRCQ